MPDFDQDQDNDQSQQKPKIRFNNPSIGSFGPSDEASPSDDESAPSEPGLPPQQESPEPPPEQGPAAGGIQSVAGSKKIRAFVKDSRHSEAWLREPNADGSGATHVRTFHSKLSDESLAYMDRVINEWLADHPECEVKFISTTIGMFTGKVKEPALICQVWV
ncbi:MAG: hypothetical protein D8M59_13005 [Planctomycetes bacterium]|nr:hypothetical protein [Planctomycetota bacterium]NOG54924.1 hypothetical protein [Planctomycetota bacterium]